MDITRQRVRAGSDSGESGQSPRLRSEGRRQSIRGSRTEPVDHRVDNTMRNARKCSPRQNKTSQ